MDDLTRQPAPIRLRDIARVLRRRALYVLVTFALVIVAANLLTARQRRIYESTARLLVDSPTTGGAAPASVLDMLRSGAGTSGLDVEVEKIKSRDFLKKVVTRAGLPVGTPPEAISSNIALIIGTGGQILTISARADHAKEAQTLANSVASVYIASVRQEFDDKSNLSEERLRSALDEARIEKDRSEKAYVDFTSRMGISSPEIYYDTQAHKTVDVKNQLADARKNLPIMRQNLENLNQQLRRIPPEVIMGHSLDKNGIIDGFRDEITRLQTRRGDMLIDYAPDSLEIQDIDRQIADRRKALDDIQRSGSAYTVGSKSVGRNGDYSKVQSQIFDAEFGIKSTSQNIPALQKQLAQLEAEQQAMGRQKTVYEELQRARSSATEVYDRTKNGLLAMNQTKVTTAPYVRVLDDAQLPGAPLSPKPLMNNLLAIGIGLILGVSMALLAELMAGGSLVDEMSGMLPRVSGIPLLGILPSPLPAPAIAGSVSPSQDMPIRLRDSFPGAATEDTLREIGYILAHRESRGPVPVVLLTATRSDESTAVFAAQLTATLVREGLRITLIDADRFQPRLNQVFGAPDAPGLTDALANRRKVDDILHVGAEGRLRFLAAGAPDDGITITRRGLRPIFKQLADPKQTDLVLISGPSVWSARLIAPLEQAASGMVLITPAMDTEEAASPEDSVARVRRVLSNGYVPRILGVVLGRGISGAIGEPDSMETIALPEAVL